MANRPPALRLHLCLGLDHPVFLGFAGPKRGEISHALRLSCMSGSGAPWNRAQQGADSGIRIESIQVVYGLATQVRMFSPKPTWSLPLRPQPQSQSSGRRQMYGNLVQLSEDLTARATWRHVPVCIRWRRGSDRRGPPAGSPVPARRHPCRSVRSTQRTSIPSRSAWNSPRGRGPPTRCT